jgi:hypothetical protein
MARRVTRRSEEDWTQVEVAKEKFAAPARMRPSRSAARPGRMLFSTGAYMDSSFPRTGLRLGPGTMPSVTGFEPIS